jgi:predicted XRE-type DNA-binding protein
MTGQYNYLYDPPEHTDNRPKMNDEVVVAADTLFLNLGFPPEETTSLQLRAQLMNQLGSWVRDRGMTQSEAAAVLGITQNRVSDLVRGKWQKFSIDKLVALAARANFNVRIELDRAT